MQGSSNSLQGWQHWNCLRPLDNLYFSSRAFLSLPGDSPCWIFRTCKVLVNGNKHTLRCFSCSHSTNGSWMNASSTLISVCWFSRSSSKVISQVFRKTPKAIWVLARHANSDRTLYSNYSQPVYNILSQSEGNSFRSFQFFALTTLIQHTRRANRGRLTFSNKQLKSTCTTSPECLSKSIFSQCRSPNPSMNPTMDMTAAVRP